MFGGKLDPAPGSAQVRRDQRRSKGSYFYKQLVLWLKGGIYVSEYHGLEEVDKRLDLAIAELRSFGEKRDEPVIENIEMAKRLLQRMIVRPMAFFAPYSDVTVSINHGSQQLDVNVIKGKDMFVVADDGTQFSWDRLVSSSVPGGDVLIALSLETNEKIYVGMQPYDLTQGVPQTIPLTE